MNKLNLWEEIKQITKNVFTSEGLHQLEHYAELFNERKLLYQRFSPAEQHGCSKGGGTHVIATLLAGAEVATSGYVEGSFPEEKEIDCDIRLNAPFLKTNGTRTLSTDIILINH